MPIKIALLAGEPSGDVLGANLLRALRERYPDLIAKGIAGPKMQEAGCETLFPMDKLSVMGLVEPLKRLPSLINIRYQFIKKIKAFKPDVFIGIDSPDFNLGVEIALKKAGIKTVHYVSPSIWAWRPKRIHKIKRAADAVLCILPFEPALYEKEKMKAIYVGHPLADEIPVWCHQEKARQHFGLPLDAKVLAILPGSRETELTHLAPTFLEVAKRCQEKNPDLMLMVPMINAKRHQQFVQLLKKSGIKLKNLYLLDGESRDAMIASDVVLMASGTASLEAMLLKRPMVVAYKMSRLTHWLAKKLIKTDFIALPNILNKKQIIPEFIQDDANPETLTAEVLKQLDGNHDALVENFQQWHAILRQKAGKKAAEAVVDLIG
jgi:lipid-A-disaccharide synthase